MSRAGERHLGVGVALVFLAGSPPISAQDGADVRPAVPVDPVTAIIEALETHQVVAFGDWHFNLQLHEVRLQLLRDPRLPDVVRDIVVEVGVSACQGVVDRYVNGEDVPRDERCRVWFDLSQGAVFEGDVYEEFYRVVREVNARLPPERRLRVVLGGDPTPLTMEGEAALIKREVIDKGRNALIVYGEMHFPRKPLYYPVSNREFAEFAFAHPDTVSTVAHLERANITVFSIFAQASDDFVAVQPDAAGWPMPALAIVSGTTFGIEPFATFVLKDNGMMVPDADGDGVHPEVVPADPARSGLTQEQFDAVLLLGPSDRLRVGEARGQ